RNQLKVAGANSEGLNLGLNSKMGAIRGSFFDANGVKRNLEGGYLRSSGLFEGIWVANGASGGWSLSQPASSKP
ncbi:MAG: hypothetical protein RLZZ399_2064, partial [Verrucomicrobiota bacterium]